ncbi:MAG: hypothetical protein D6706_13685, partial [Chloroflexi bacterium]
YDSDDGSIDITVTGGNPPYTYHWTTGDSTEDLSGLTRGFYSVTVVDANGCSISRGVNLLAPAPLVATLTKQDVSCHGGNDGAIYSNVQGGTPPYSYLWNTTDTTSDLTGIPAGTYTLTVTDFNGCTVSVSRTVNQPQPIVITGTVTDVSCAGNSDGAIDIQVSGGTPAYIFNWSNSSGSEDLNGIPSGNYMVTVTDANGCTATAAFVVGSPAPIQSGDSIVYISCYGESDGAIYLNPSGGSGVYTYYWSTGDTTSFIDSLSAGVYSVTITDSSGCAATFSFTLSSPGRITGYFVKTRVSCFGGSDGTATIIVSGGTPPYTYTWSNGDQGPTADSLSAGIYQVTVMDNNGCSATAAVNIRQAPRITGSFTRKHVSCYGGNDGAIDVTVQGGTPPYTFLWSTNDTTEDISGLTAGSYSVTITDANGCTRSGRIFINQPDSLTLAFQVNHVSCFGSADGMVSVTVAGGVPPYQQGLAH